MTAWAGLTVYVLKIVFASYLIKIQHSKLNFCNENQIVYINTSFKCHENFITRYKTYSNTFVELFPHLLNNFTQLGITQKIYKLSKKGKL